MSNKTALEIKIAASIFKLAGISPTDTITPLIECDPLKLYDSKQYLFHFTGNVLYSRTDLTERQLEEQFVLLTKYLGISGEMEFLDKSIKYHIFVTKKDKSNLSQYIVLKKDTKEVIRFAYVKNALAFFTIVNAMLEEYIRWCYASGFSYSNALILPTPKPDILETSQWQIVIDRWKGQTT